MTDPAPADCAALLSGVAGLMRLRDREAMDAAWLALAMRALPLQGAAIYRATGDRRDPRLRREACLPAQGAAHGVSQEALPERIEAQHRLLRPVPTARPCGAMLAWIASQPFTRAQAALADSLVQVLVSLLDLLDHAERDMLTGLLNRKTFDESFMKTAVGRPSVREGEPPDEEYWFGVADIDHFKKVNDTYGHLIGDEVLILLARLLESNFRQHDRLYRFGGEEFVVLMRCHGRADAAAAFERLRRRVHACVFPQVGHITISVGFTRIRPGESPMAAFERADRAVYHAKANGRNRVCDYDRLVADGGADDLQRQGDIELF